MGLLFPLLLFFLFINILNNRLPFILDKLINDPLLGVMIVLALISGITIHEFAHAFVAYRLGDPTAKLQGRMNLNPQNHLDPIGSAAIIFIGIGWGKPTPFDPFNLRDIKRDSALISVAGAVSNFLLALAISLPFLAFEFMSGPNPLREIYTLYLSPFIFFNILLGVFNLIPIAPLDGFKVVAGLLPKDWYHDFMQTERYGVFILLLFLFFANGFIFIARATSYLFNILAPGIIPPF